MNIEEIINICRALPSTTEDVKWKDDLCFMIGDKMFCVVVLTDPTKISLKVIDEEFEELCSSDAIISAPYTGRYKWIQVENIEVFSLK